MFFLPHTEHSLQFIIEALLNVRMGPGAWLTVTKYLNVLVSHLPHSHGTRFTEQLPDQVSLDPKHRGGDGGGAS